MNVYQNTHMSTSKNQGAKLTLLIFYLLSYFKVVLNRLKANLKQLVMNKKYLHTLPQRNPGVHEFD